LRAVVGRGTTVSINNTGGIYPHHKKVTETDASFLSPLFWLGWVKEGKERIEK
jgi:hypothetical protein